MESRKFKNFNADMSPTPQKQKRTEEEKRNLKIDLRKVPEWNKELEAIRLQFGKFNIQEVIEAATLVYSMASRFGLVPGLRDRSKLLSWKKSLTVDRIVKLKNDYSAPEFIKSGIAGDVVSEIHKQFHQTSQQLSDCQARGSTQSILISMFTSKVHEDTLRAAEEKQKFYLYNVQQIPKLEKSLRILDDLRSTSGEYSARATQLINNLALAEEKRRAIDRFEAKHGKAFAKAAAADKKTRNRAASIRQIVEKTNDCPYCGRELDGDPHLDHIYPVSKGGLSIVENLVWCCFRCNNQKSDKGLIQFLVENDMSIEHALGRLQKLGKHV